MSARVEAAVAVLRAVAARPDPTRPLALSAVARTVGLAPSAASRLCAEMVQTGLLSRGADYGSVGIGARAVALSGRAASGIAGVVQFELHRIAQETTETVVLAAPERDGVRVTAMVGSGWTLHVPATIGDRVGDPRRAVVRAAHGGTDDDGVVESRVGRAVEIAVPLLAPDGRRAGVLGVALPVYRATRARPRIRRVLAEARRAIERALAHRPPPDEVRRGSEPPARPPAVEAAALVLERLAAAPAPPAAVAAATGLRVDRARRLTDALVRAGIVVRGGDALHLDPGVHGWYRAATPAVLGRSGPERAAATAARTRTCVFVTALRGMRSFTLVEHIEPLGEGLLMAPWLGRPHPLVGSDGGPTLAMDFTPDELATLFPRRHGAVEYEQFAARVAHVRREGVLTMRSIDEFGITSVSAPVRDAAGLVTAAACIVGATEDVAPRLPALEAAARALADALSSDLRAPERTSIADPPAVDVSPIPPAR